MAHTTLDELIAAAQKAADASTGDSNDAEIEALREALEMALEVIGLTIPEPRPRCHWCDEPVDELVKADPHCTNDHCQDCVHECVDCGPEVREDHEQGVA